MHRIILAVFALLVATHWAKAQSLGVSGDWSYEHNSANNEATIVGYSGSDSAVLIPAMIEGHTVTKVARHPYSNSPVFGWFNTTVTSVTIPDSVTSIDELAFYGSVALTSVTIGEGVTSIGAWAFVECSSLTSVSIPDSVTSIGDSAFQSCTSLTSVTIGKGVTSIGERAFSACTSLTSIDVDAANLSFSSGNGVLFDKNGQTLVTFPGGISGDYSIPENVISIGDFAFESCTGLTNVAIPSSVTSIGRYSFSSCTSLISVAIPNSVTSIGHSAFSDCTGLTSVSIPDSVTSIGDGAFLNCASLTFVSIPNSVTSIGILAFGNCASLTSVFIPDSVTSIGVSAFAGCASLASVIIPASVTSIGYQAFLRCDSLTQISVEATNPSYSSINGVLFDKNAQVLITFPGGISGDYSIPDGVASIARYSFWGCKSLTGVTIPDSVTSIGDAAFANCTGLTRVNIGNSVASITEYAFWGCTSLASVTIPDNVTSIGVHAFMLCASLTSAIIGNGVTTIGKGVFDSCSSLTSVYFLGNAPSWNGETFNRISPVGTVYYAAGTTGWGPTFDTWPTKELPIASLLTSLATTQFERGQASVRTNPSAFGLYTAQQYGANYTNGQTDVTTTPAAFNLFTQSQYDNNRTAGHQDVMASPMAYGLYDSTSIMDLRMGGLMIQKQGTSATVFFQPETTTDLASIPFADNGLPMTKTFEMPENKHFLRIQALPGSPGQMITLEGGILPQSSQLAGTVVETFQIHSYEVTWGEWQAVSAWGAANGYDLQGVGEGSSAQHPVQKVSWLDAVKWCNAKSEREGLEPVYEVAGAVYRTGQIEPSVNGQSDGYRLPSQAEWEWAARGGLSSGGFTYSGSNDLRAVAWFAGNTSDGPKPVGTKQANELGIHDMTGNVWEWCQDIYQQLALIRVFAGGSANSRDESPRFLPLSSTALGQDQRLPGSDIGFRVARDAEE